MFMLKQKYKSLKQKGKSMKKQKNAQIIILFEIPGKGVAGRKGGQKE